jgi:predicted amidophosphoribosyltransferase
MRCKGCGAELKPGADACPLCGTESGRAVVRERAPGLERFKTPDAPVSVDDYQADVRKLREQLRRLRDEGAEAV